MSHVLAPSSSLFPEGEDFFVRSVRNYRDRIDDPVLKKAVGGFIGQEAIHGREHRTFNRRLRVDGLPDLAGRPAHQARAVAARPGHPESPTRSAVTAALEHYTATLAELLMGEAEAERAADASPRVRSPRCCWHAIEESEHKAVAFDVFQHVSGRHIQRSLVMRCTDRRLRRRRRGRHGRLAAARRRTYRHPVLVARSLRRARRSIFLRRSTIDRIKDYHRRDFHPDDNENVALLEEWRTALFGDDGTLTGRPPGRGVDSPTWGPLAGGEASTPPCRDRGDLCAGGGRHAVGGTSATGGPSSSSSACS